MDQPAVAALPRRQRIRTPPRLPPNRRAGSGVRSCQRLEPRRLQRPANRGAALLAEAKKLYTSGNYQAAKQIANEAKAGKFGVEAQADELIAQIALTEQGGALSLYEVGTGGPALG